MTEWEALKEECLRCQACTLAATRTNVVFGVGAEDAEVLFIGEAPGANEDAQGEPAYNSLNAFKIRSPVSPLFSGWNWVPYTLPARTAPVTGME